MLKVKSLSRVRLFATPWTVAHQAPLSMEFSRQEYWIMSIESVMPSNHLILCHPLLLLPSIFPSGPTHVARLEFPRETGLILRCAGKAGNPFQTTQGNRLSCRHQEGRRV